LARRPERKARPYENMELIHYSEKIGGDNPEGASRLARRREK
jgi:hypothetical protein